MSEANVRRRGVGIPDAARARIKWRPYQAQLPAIFIAGGLLAFVTTPKHGASGKAGDRQGDR